MFKQTPMTLLSEENPAAERIPYNPGMQPTAEDAQRQALLESHLEQFLRMHRYGDVPQAPFPPGLQLPGLPMPIGGLGLWPYAPKLMPHQPQLAHLADQAVHEAAQRLLAADSSQQPQRICSNPPAEAETKAHKGQDCVTWRSLLRLLMVRLSKDQKLGITHAVLPASELAYLNPGKDLISQLRRHHALRLISELAGPHTPQQSLSLLPRNGEVVALSDLLTSYLGRLVTHEEAERCFARGSGPRTQQAAQAGGRILSDLLGDKGWPPYMGAPGLAKASLSEEDDPASPSAASANTTTGQLLSVRRGSVSSDKDLQAGARLDMSTGLPADAQAKTQLSTRQLEPNPNPPDKKVGRFHHAPANPPQPESTAVSPISGPHSQPTWRCLLRCLVVDFDQHQLMELLQDYAPPPPPSWFNNSSRQDDDEKHTKVATRKVGRATISLLRQADALEVIKSLCGKYTPFSSASVPRSGELALAILLTKYWGRTVRLEEAQGFFVQSDHRLRASEEFRIQNGSRPWPPFPLAKQLQVSRNHGQKQSVKGHSRAQHAKASVKENPKSPRGGPKLLREGDAAGLGRKSCTWRTILRMLASDFDHQQLARLIITELPGMEAVASKDYISHLRRDDCMVLINALAGPHVPLQALKHPRGGACMAMAELLTSFWGCSVTSEEAESFFDCPRHQGLKTTAAFRARNGTHRTWPPVLPSWLPREYSQGKKGARACEPARVKGPEEGPQTEEVELLASLIASPSPIISPRKRKACASDDSVDDSEPTLSIKRSVQPRGTWLSYEDVQSFVRAMGLTKQSDWNKWCNLGGRPGNIPRNPDHVYRGKGWVSWPSFLGYGTWEFPDARKFAQDNGVHSKEEWFALNKAGLLPRGLPCRVDAKYKDSGWAGWADFLGTMAGSPPSPLKSAGFVHEQ